MVECYISCHKNSVRASEEYFRRYQDHRQPCLKQFKKLYDNLERYGSFSKPRNQSKGINEATQINVLASVNIKLSSSTREIAANTSTSQHTVVRTLKSHRFHPYKLVIDQTLHAGDEDRLPGVL